MLRRLAFLAIISLLLAGCGAPRPIVVESSPPPALLPSATPTPSAIATLTPSEPPTTPTIAETATPVEEGWQTYTNDAGGYTLDIPASWSVSGEPAASVMFFAQDADLQLLGTGEAQYFAGGVEILGFIADAPDPYLEVLPNHSAIIEMREISTPLGAGRVYTLRRDRFQSTGSETVWYAQHAMIPLGSRILEIWIQADSTTGGSPTLTLGRMLSSLRLD